jgi:type IV pilus assembly protein PilA
MNKLQKGVTLVELMSIVAIISVLAAIALPVYSDYTIRARVVELLSIASGAKAGVQDKFSADGAGSFSTGYSSVYAFGSATADFASGSIGNSDAIITINGTVKTGNISLTLTPNINSGALTWSCTGSPLRYLPASCN